MADKTAGDLYRRRKKRRLEIQAPRPTFATNSLRSHDRPHTVLPELEEHYPDIWIPEPLPPPPPPPPPPPVRVMR